MWDPAAIKIAMLEVSAHVKWIIVNWIEGKVHIEVKKVPFERKLIY